EFTLDGTTFRAINGGPVHAGFTETISFSVTCADQAEVDHYWESLTADGGEPSVCGWLKDRFGLSWQIVPRRLYELMEDPDPARATAATEAMLQMRKIVVAELEAAADAAGR
ncbi:MAG TPA: VOC family protein, partial [Nocardioides sp.]|nr:VOC family protein [Nocardioides sp.]